MKLAKWIVFGAVTVAVWAALALYLAFYGTWMKAVAEQGNTTEFYDWAVSEIGQNNSGNSALVLLDDGEVVKEFFSGAAGDIDRNTLFPTASFSKWITALIVMSLVENQQVDLDAPVSRYLTRWQLPGSEFDNDNVTVRRLLSHTAGLTDGLGFGDYTAEERIPTVEKELANPRASNGAVTNIVVGVEPGAEFQYSGGGYLILQLLVEEVSGVTFAQFVRRSILEPVGMSRSTYKYLGALDNVSKSYARDGSVAPTFQYASPAATGFSSSAGDLSKLAQVMLAGGPGVLAKPTTLEAMREPHGFAMGAGIWGLGTILYVEAPNGDYVFGHDGANDPAINSTLRINPESSDGIVLLVSGHPTLASNIGSEWVLWQTGYPGFLLTKRALESAVMPILVGSFFLLLILYLLFRR